MTAPAATPAPAAPAPTTTPAAPAAAPAPATEHWSTSIQDEALRGWAQSRAWPSVEAALGSHRQLESLRGVPEDRLLKLPESAEDKAGWAAVHQRLGAPKDAAGYELPAVEPKDGQVDISSDFRTWALEQGLSQTQASGLFEAFNERMGVLVQEREDAAAQKSQVEMQELKTAWGDKYQENELAARKASNALGLSTAELDSIQDVVGYKRTFELMHRIGTGIGELSGAEQGGGAGPTFGVTREQAAADLAAMRADRATMDDVVKNATGAARQKYERLLRIAHPS